MSWLREIFELFFPNRCIYCKKVLQDEAFACKDCEKKLSFVEEIPYGEELGRVERLYCALYYSGAAPQGIAQYKFKGKPRLHRYFSTLMLDHMGWALADEDVDLVVAVPMYPARKRARGYNQAELLAKDLAEWLNVPCSDCLKKVTKSKQQHTLSGQERRLAQKGSYRCAPLRGEKILLVDDVCTTGETMKECARVLKEAGASAVIAAAICKTPGDREIGKIIDEADGNVI